MYEMVTSYFPFFTPVNLYFPFKSVVTPRLKSFIYTLAPIAGSPSSSNMVPDNELD